MRFVGLQPTLSTISLIKSIHRASQKKVDDRMEGVTIDTAKEKLGTPGFLKSIGTIFSKLSPQPTDAIQVDGSQPSSEEEEDDDDEEEEDEEEEEEEDENKKNLDNRSFEEQREDWAQTKGKALARTPIQPKRLYPNLEEVEEDEQRLEADLRADSEDEEVEEDEQRLGADLRADSEDGDDESVDEAGPSKPARRNRNLRVKGQPPTRISTRIRGEPPAPLENDHIEINTETVINEQENLSIINELRRAKSSYSESDEEEITVNRKNLIKRVEQKEKVETRPTSDSDEEQVTEKITNPRKKVEQKGKVEENKKTKVRNAGVPKEEAKHGALMASEPLNDEALCDSEVEPEETILAKDCRNQQQMTIALLAQVPAFNGMGSTKFEDWIKHFERLFGSAEDCITTFQLCYPKEAKSFTKATENCVAILNEAKLEKRNVEFINAISTNSNSQALSEIKKEAEGWEMASEKNQQLLSDLLQKKEEKKQKKRGEGFINAVSTNSNVQAMDDTKRDLEELKITAKNNQKLLSDMMQQARETTKLMNQVSQLQAQAVVPNQSVFPPQNQNNQQTPITAISSWKEIPKGHSRHPNTAASRIIRQTDIHLGKLNIALIVQKPMQAIQ
ncbi:hypothetical protein DAPPUDRAFT_252637 [Daphnia pulex]|uniref:Uncharacterized protein n=1 Tax=Daphnia pulex TaxID=6669 RepID=E9H358_DAPPU|nr:hypothetical protein DAPPUDRAFT_252637 [Daphnia pulex]|eukprot:EFX73696.1 hypothetical protein DAPPUDRAFT_252637 [Daphnia pulex]